MGLVKALTLERSIECWIESGSKQQWFRFKRGQTILRMEGTIRHDGSFKTFSRTQLLGCYFGAS
jgi:hypothetical protein